MLVFGDTALSALIVLVFVNGSLVRDPPLETVINETTSSYVLEFQL